jgi:hypothetical protein
MDLVPLTQEQHRQHQEQQQARAQLEMANQARHLKQLLQTYKGFKACSSQMHCSCQETKQQQQHRSSSGCQRCSLCC